MTVVIDTSVLVEILVRSEAGAKARQWLNDGVHSPDLIYPETLSVFRRWERTGKLTRARASQACQDLADLPIKTWAARLMVTATWRLRHNLSAYDAQYAALASTLSLPLITLDTRLVRAIRTAGVCQVVSPPF
ncbi:MAG: type II toxin-antitoxin system VapC family toxin [Propionibacteriaceae bacterium]|jgi:predicted nucleic acid-binding protein|nr:type II toxin-antitoxin system VapC family toxin [Propionibacteriaceae bacterium]